MKPTPFYVSAACCLLGLSSSLAEDTPAAPTQNQAEAEKLEQQTVNWLRDSLTGKKSTPPKDQDLANAEAVNSTEESIWKSYSKAATLAGWNKQLMPNPEPINEVIKAGKKPQIKASVLSSGDFKMPYTIMAKGTKPKEGWPLFITMHGGGKYHGKEKMTAHGWQVNSREWQAQMKLTAAVYKPDGLYFIPRMADDRKGRWWQKHNIDIFTRMIRHAILFNEVDPNRVYIMGISQGGYGSCHLAPFMADLFAAAGPMAGGRKTITENLRNLPFRSDIGENDTAYKRITLAKELHDSIDELKAKDPEGYKNKLAIQKGRGHGIDYSQSPSWLADNIRNPHPDKVVWRCYAKDGIYRDSFYWLSLSKTPEEGEFSIVASVDKTTNTINLTAEEVIPSKEKGEEPSRKPLSSSDIIVHLNDHILDLDKPVQIALNGKKAFSGKVRRSRNTMLKNLTQRGDINYAFPVNITVKGQ